MLLDLLKLKIDCTDLVDNHLKILVEVQRNFTNKRNDPHKQFISYFQKHI